MIASAILPAAQMLYGAFQAIKSNSELKKLRNQDISYQATPETQKILGMARDNAMHGYSEAEKQAFLQTVAGNSAKAYRMGMSRAGNSLSNAIGASNQIANGQAMNQFAANDANLQRQNQNIYFGQVGQEQNRQNMNTAMEVNNNRMAQQSYGNAMSQGIENAFGGLQMGTMVAEDIWGKKDPNSGTPDPNVYMGQPQMQYGQQFYGSPYNVPYPPMNSIWNPYFKR